MKFSVLRKGRFSRWHCHTSKASFLVVCQACELNMEGRANPSIQSLAWAAF